MKKVTDKDGVCPFGMVRGIRPGFLRMVPAFAKTANMLCACKDGSRRYGQLS